LACMNWWMLAGLVECDRRSCSAIADLVGWVEARNPTSSP
jgi:hypothetical protein